MPRIVQLDVARGTAHVTQAGLACTAMTDTSDTEDGAPAEDAYDEQRRNPVPAASSRGKYLLGSVHEGKEEERELGCSNPAGVSGGQAQTVGWIRDEEEDPRIRAGTAALARAEPVGLCHDVA